MSEGRWAKRQLSRLALNDYLAQLSPAVVTIPGSPSCRLVTDPQSRSISLRVTADNQTLQPLDLENVELRVISENSTRWFELKLDYGDHAYESYLFLSDVADLIQLENISFVDAVDAAVATFEEILARSRSLSRESQVGLFGELLFFLKCVARIGPQAAIEAWKGYTRNEHDFVLASGAFEIKTTTSETRRHRISSFEQLQPLPRSPLWLVSVQITSGTQATGRTLAQLIDESRRSVGEDADFDRKLAQAGWRERDRTSYRTYYRPRSAPRVYLVDKSFPALTRGAVVKGCTRPELILEGTYTIDVTALEPSSAPAPADEFVEEGKI